MKTTAAVCVEPGKPLELTELDVRGPLPGEVLIRYTHAGLCRSDLHVMHGDLPAWLPLVLGHEGAGVVEDVGAGVTRVEPGDHVVCSFIPSCGHCHWCATGRQNLCDSGATIMRGYLPGDSWPLSGPAGHYGAMCMLGTFSQYGVIHETSAVKIDPDLPLDKAALVGCGVPTGWGASVHSADVRPGETVVVYGTGGIGLNAVQGARFAGAMNVIAVDPLASKREAASQFGATHVCATADEARELAWSLTRGRGAEKAVVTVGRMSSDVVTEAFEAVGKAGTVVLVAVAGIVEQTVELPGNVATFWRKTVRGSLFGDCNPTTDIPRLLALYRTGDLILDELVTRTYSLEQVNEGYDDLEAGKNLRGVIVHEH